MKNVNLMTFVPVLIVSCLSFASNIAVAQNAMVNIAITSALTYDDDFLKGDEAFVMSVIQQEDKLKVSVEIAPDYYLYRSKFSFNGRELTLNPIELPIGITYQDEYFGVQQIYKTQLSFILNIEKAHSGATISVTYQGCAVKGLCYPPTTKTVMVNEVKVK